jgi:hypothetical protein
MVTDAIASAFTDIINFFVSLLPGWSLPSWFTSLPGDASSLGSAIGSFNVWLPISAVTDVLAVILTATTVAFSVRFVRMAISFFTGGGGSVS